MGKLGGKLGITKKLDIFITNVEGNIVDHWKHETSGVIDADEVMRLRYNNSQRENWLQNQIASPNPIISFLGKWEYRIERAINGLKRIKTSINHNLYQIVSIKNLVTGGLFIAALYLGHEVSENKRKNSLFYQKEVKMAMIPDADASSPAKKAEKKKKYEIAPLSLEEKGIITLLPPMNPLKRDGKRLPSFKLMQFENGSTVPSKKSEEGIAYSGMYALNRAEFAIYLKKVYEEFEKYEDDYNINALVETARHTYEAWFPEGGLFKPSPLFVGTGNGGGNKCFDKENPSYVCMVDDRQNADKYGRSRFYNFSRDNFFDISKWVEYQATIQMQSGFYKQARQDYESVEKYCLAQGVYSTNPNYCKSLLGRSLEVKRILNL